MTEILNWLQSLISGFATVGSWLVTPLPGIGIAPLVIASSAGLLIFLGVAIAKWLNPFS